METETKKDENSEALEALKRLSKHSDFIVWREFAAKPLIDQWELQLQQAENMSEVELRATIKLLNTIKALFYKWFEQI